MKRRRTCRVCLDCQLKLVLDLGMTPLANSYVTANHLDEPEMFYPLQVNQCGRCGNLQLAHVVEPELLFKKYLYASSTSQIFVNHFDEFAQKMGQKKFVVDIGSNDGILLKPFERMGSKVLGIEPAKNIVSSVPVIKEFFSEKLAKRIRRKYGWADLVTATNVFAHIDDLDEVLNGVKELLSPGGQFVVEVCDVEEMIKTGSFDLIYHEHLNYWSEDVFRTFFKRRDMEVTEVERVPVHGGSLRIYARISK